MSAPGAVVDVGSRDDEHLMAQIAEGDDGAFGELYDRYCRRAYRVARSICRQDERAQDAVQEAFISIWKSRTTYRQQRGTVAGWVLTVVRYRAIDVARRHRLTALRQAVEDVSETLPASGDLAGEAVARAEARHLRSLLARLPEAQREVITLAYYGQLSHTAIAARLGLPTGTVKGRMRLGLQKLRGDLEQVSA